MPVNTTAAANADATTSLPTRCGAYRVIHSPHNCAGTFRARSTGLTPDGGADCRNTVGRRRRPSAAAIRVCSCGVCAVYDEL